MGKPISIELDYDTALFLLNIIRQALVAYSLMPKNLQSNMDKKRVKSLDILVNNLQKQLED